MKKTDKIKTGAKIRTKRGYEGVFYATNPAGTIAYVALNGCTYSDDDWYDSIPLKDIELLQAKKK